MKLSRVKYRLNKIVRCKGTGYILTACILRYKQGTGYYYQAELQDLKARSVVIVKLEDVEEER